MNLVEVFVEQNCAACEAVLALLENISPDRQLMKRIFHRGKDREEFQSRGIAIVPATFINRQLAFYGEFSTHDFHRQLLRLRQRT